MNDDLIAARAGHHHVVVSIAPLRHEHDDRLAVVDPRPQRADMPEIIRLAAQGTFRPEKTVTRRFPLVEADAAYQALDRGEILGRAIVMT